MIEEEGYSQHDMPVTILVGNLALSGSRWFYLFYSIPSSWEDMWSMYSLQESSISVSLCQAFGSFLLKSSEAIVEVFYAGGSFGTRIDFLLDISVKFH